MRDVRWQRFFTLSYHTQKQLFEIRLRSTCTYVSKYFFLIFLTFFIG
jgi:hypothetical protein